MKYVRFAPAAVLLMLLGIALSATLIGCLTSGGAVTSQNAAAPEPPPQSTAEVDKNIADLRRKILDLQKFQTEQRHIAVINEVQHQKSAGWVKLDGQPTNEEAAETANQQATAAEKEIQKLSRELSRAEAERDKMRSISSGCFAPETLVKMEDGSSRPIARIRAGEKIMAYDIGYGRQVGKTVVAVYTAEANHLYTINGALMTTAGERVLSGNGWKAVRDLQKGDVIHVDGRMVEVERIEFQRVDLRVHNMQVADSHNFYVVAGNGSGFLVHNSGGGGGGGK